MNARGSHKPIEAIVSEQPLNAEEKALLEEAYSRLSIFRKACEPYHNRAKEARQIILLQDPQQTVKVYDKNGNVLKSEPIMQVQTLKSSYTNAVADQVDNTPEAKLIPETPEMQEVASDVQDIVRFVLEQNDFQALSRRRAEDFLGTGTAVTQIAWDKDMDFGKGNIAVFRWPIENFLWDPLADTIQEARAVIKVSWHPLSWFSAHFPEKAKYIGSEENEHDGVGMPDSQNELETGEEPRAMLMEYWYRLYDAKKRKYTINVAYLAGRALLLVSENVYAHGMYPFVLDAMTPIEGLPIGDGMVQELAPMMRYINRYIYYLDENIRMSASAQLLVDKRAGIDPNDLADRSKHIVEASNMGDYVPQWLQTKPLTSVATTQLLQLQSDLKQDSGQNQFSRGETTGGVTAFSAIDALQAAGAKITRLRTQTLNDGFKLIVEQILWLMSEFYTNDRKRMITGNDNAYREVDMSPARLFGVKQKGSIPPPPYTVQVQVQRRNPLRVQAMNDMVIQAYNMAAQSGVRFPLSVLFEILDYDGKDRILPRLRAIEEEQNAMMQLVQENEQLKAGIGNLQQALGQMGGTLMGENEQPAEQQM